MIRVSESMVDPRWLKQLVKSVETYSGVKKQLKFFRRDDASSTVYLPRYFAQEKLKLDLSINRNYACPPMSRKYRINGSLQETKARPQQSAFVAVTEALQTKSGATCVMAVGSGKTHLAIAVAVALGPVARA